MTIPEIGEVTSMTDRPGALDDNSRHDDGFCELLQFDFAQLQPQPMESFGTEADRVSSVSSW